MAICSFALITDNKKILLVKLAEVYKFAGHWNFPGGVVEQGQSIKSSVVREVFEETSINIKVKNEICSFSHTENDITIYLAEYISGDIKIQEDEISDAQWFSFSEALELPLAYNAKTIIKDYLESINL